MKCFVSNSYEEYQENVNASNSRKIPAELMDCKEWSDRKDKAWREHIIQKEKEMEWFEQNGADKETCIGPYEQFIEYLKNVRWCKDDCQFCEIDRRKYDDGQIIEYVRQCAGPNDTQWIKDYPKNTCKKYGTKDIIPGVRPNYKCEASNITIVQYYKFGELCTCSTDGCNKPKDEDYPILPEPTPNPIDTNPPNPNSTSLSTNPIDTRSENSTSSSLSTNPIDSNPPNPNSTSLSTNSIHPKPQTTPGPTNTNNNNTNENLDDNSNKTISDHATHLIILDYLLILGLFLLLNF